VDDISHLSKANPVERDNVVAVVHSPVVSLQNDLSVHFLDVWIREICIDVTPKINEFLTDDSEVSEQLGCATIKLSCKTRVPVKKKESSW
jgi:hypothetical protein